MQLEPDTLRDILQRFSQANTIKTWWLAYSGGVDSQVLLHLLAQLKLNVKAVYVDHGLQKESKQWEKHCEESCRKLAIPFQSISVDAKAGKGESPEAAARKARYEALASLIEKQDCLLTAQHRDDQAETFLLQLFRGAGAAGLSSMPFCNEFSAGWHLRPLLEFTRKQILDYAQTHQLAWVEDPSNLSNQYDRNFLRNEIFPLLKQRWQSIDKTLSIAANQQAENASLLDQLAATDLNTIIDHKEGLSVEKLSEYDEQRLRNILRHWIKHLDIPVPPRNVLQQIMQQMFTDREDADPLVKWPDAEMHRYRNRLYVFSSTEHDDNQIFEWNGRDDLYIESLHQSLFFDEIESKGLNKGILNRSIQVRFRQGGEEIKPCGREGTHKLKKLFQEAGVPSWKRSRIPLLFLDDELIAVTGYWLAEKYCCKSNEVGLVPRLNNLGD